MLCGIGGVRVRLEDLPLLLLLLLVASLMTEELREARVEADGAVAIITVLWWRRVVVRLHSGEEQVSCVGQTMERAKHSCFRAATFSHASVCLLLVNKVNIDTCKVGDQQRYVQKNEPSGQTYLFSEVTYPFLTTF